MSLIVLLLTMSVALWLSVLMDAFPALLWNWIYWPQWIGWIGLLSLLAWFMEDKSEN